MSLIIVQRMQFSWVGLGLTYNGLSLWRISSGDIPLSPTDPVAGSIFLVICGSVILAGIKGANTFYRFATPALALLLLYSGLGLHVIAFVRDANLFGYASFASWLAAVVVNTYGATTLLLGSWFASR